ncbi:MAG: phosphoribosyltransferase family protein [Balneolales bacterium]
MEYRSFADLSNDITKNLYKLPVNVDLIVGIPRSGLLAGNLIALSLNIPLIDLDGFIENRKPSHGLSRETKARNFYPREAKHVLIVDDTILSGKSLAHAKNKIERASINQPMTYCTVYADPRNLDKVDVYLERLSSPRAFEWNIMHNHKLEHFCVDMDGVLCKDPTKDEMDDGPAYLSFLKNTQPLSLPSLKVGYLITSRPEEYRKETEAWLSKHNITYTKLYMPDLAGLKTHQKRNAQITFKTQVFKKYTGSRLFIESEQKQAMEIANITGKPVLCFSNQKLYTPELSAAMIKEKARSYHTWTINKAERIIGRLLKLSGLKVEKPVKKRRYAS